MGAAQTKYQKGERAKQLQRASKAKRMLNPEYRAKLAEQARERRKTPEYQAWTKAYKSREDVKEKNKLRMRKYRQTYAGYWTFRHYQHQKLLKNTKQRLKTCEVCINPTDFIAF